MLGWEFPPLLTGGLGIACYGLSKAMAEYAELTVIVPRSDPSFKVDQFNLIGLNHIRLKDAVKEQHDHDYHHFAAVREIAIDLNPYPVAERPAEIRPIPLPAGIEPIVEIHAAEAEALFGDTDVYGPDILKKVAAYTEVVCKLAKTLDFDLIHAHDWITYSAAIRLKQESGKPLVVHVHSLETDRVHPGARNMVYHIELRGMQAADRVIPVSLFTRDNIIREYGIEAAKIRPVHNGVAPVQRFHTKKQAGEKWVLFLGRVTRQKSPVMMLEAARKLVKKMPGVKFYVAGTGDQLNYLKTEVERAGLSASFVFTGFISKEEVGMLLSKADVYFMPSVSEPFGLSAVEAAQFDIPCVISKQSGVAEILHHALKADFWDTDKFSDLLYAVLNFDGIRETMVEHTRNDLTSITWPEAAKKINEIYTELIF